MQCLSSSAFYALLLRKIESDLSHKLSKIFKAQNYAVAILWNLALLHVKSLK